ncbi:virB8 family protein [Sphingomonas sp.]|uniref:virB8 family protein n=1 Tax=Sphingomonas sp. TaxID=28214 RepID=UPI003B3B062D
MNDHNREMLDAYYKDAASWNTDRLKELRSSRRIAWRVALAATCVAILEAGALFLLIPLKTVEPYTLLVDKTTGYVQALRPLSPSRVAPDAALTQSFLVQYVIARESFDLTQMRANYRKVALLSAEGARTMYLAQMQPTNSLSPLATYPRGTIVETRVKSISPIGDNAVLVRFDTIRTDANSRPRPPLPWVSVVRFRYSGQQMKLEDRFVNPLGFQVVQYRRDPEALPLEPVNGGPAGTRITGAGGMMAPPPARVNIGAATSAPRLAPSQ